MDQSAEIEVLRRRNAELEAALRVIVDTASLHTGRRRRYADPDVLAERVIARAKTRKTKNA